MVENAQLEEAVAELMTAEAIKAGLTKRQLCRRLEEKFGLPENGLDDKYDDIESFIEKVIDKIEIDDDEDDDAESSAENKTPNGKRKGAAATTRSPKKARGGSHEEGVILTRQFFTDNAPALEGKIGNIDFTIEPREFATKSCGWFYGAKKDLEVGGKSIECRLNINITVVGSKQWKE